MHIGTSSFAARFEGFVRLTATGPYTFYLPRNTNAKLWIDNSIMVETGCGSGLGEANARGMGELIPWTCILFDSLSCLRSASEEPSGPASSRISPHPSDGVCPRERQINTPVGALQDSLCRGANHSRFFPFCAENNR